MKVIFSDLSIEVIENDPIVPGIFLKHANQHLLERKTSIRANCIPSSEGNVAETFKT